MAKATAGRSPEAHPAALRGVPFARPPISPEREWSQLGVVGSRRNASRSTDTAGHVGNEINTGASAGTKACAQLSSAAWVTMTMGGEDLGSGTGLLSGLGGLKAGLKFVKKFDPQLAG